MRYSDNYELNLVEGSDLVNPLIQDVPNYEKIDEQMYLNSIASIAQAVELKSGTVHALTRDNPDAAMFRFVATSRFDSGDTFTVDGIQVTGLLTDGTPLSDGAYVINANVLCCLVGTVLTLYTVPGEIQTAQNALKLGNELPSFYGKASDVQTALNTANAAGLLAQTASSNVTAIEGTINKLVTCSTTEEKIGTWFGKDLYRKSYEVQVNQRTGDIMIDNTLTQNNCTIVGCSAFGSRVGDSNILLPFDSTVNNVRYFALLLSNASGFIFATSLNSFSVVYVTVDYVKN